MNNSKSSHHMINIFFLTSFIIIWHQIKQHICIQSNTKFKYIHTSHIYLFIYVKATPDRIIILQTPNLIKHQPQRTQ